MDKVRPTKKQKELLNFIDGFIKGYGYGPSYREIMRALEYKSVSTVAVHVDSLITRGWLVKKDKSARSLMVVKPEEHLPARPARLDVSAEKVIKAKVDELKQDYQANAYAIGVLSEALKILGYTDAEQTQVV